MANQQSPKKLSGFAKALNYTADQEEYLEARTHHPVLGPRHLHANEVLVLQKAGTIRARNFDPLTLFLLGFAFAMWTHNWLELGLLIAWVFVL